MELAGDSQNIDLANFDDGICDDELNIEKYNFDNGDCCEDNAESRSFCQICLCNVTIIKRLKNYFGMPVNGEWLEDNWNAKTGCSFDPRAADDICHPGMRLI